MQNIGIDIGKSAIHVSIATGDNPKQYPVHIIEYKYDYWWQQLLSLIEPPTTVAAEPTGWHYFKPIVTVLEMHPLAEYIEVLQINHDVTASVRRASFGRAKNDRIDSQVIAHIAANRHSYIGWKPYNHDLHTTTHSLRLLINEHRRLTKNSTRKLNQLDALAHSIFPQLAINRDTWLKCVLAGYIDPTDIRELIASGRPENIHPNSFRFIRERFSKLPNIEANTYIKANIERAADDWQRIQSELTDIEAEISERVTQPPFGAITARWMTVPFLNEISAAKLHVATDGQADQMSISQFKASVGVAPTTGISGRRHRQNPHNTLRLSTRQRRNFYGHTRTIHRSRQTQPDSPLLQPQQKEQRGVPQKISWHSLRHRP